MKENSSEDWTSGWEKICLREQFSSSFFSVRSRWPWTVRFTGSAATPASPSPAKRTSRPGSPARSAARSAPRNDSSWRRGTALKPSAGTHVCSRSKRWETSTSVGEFSVRTRMSVSCLSCRQRRAATCAPPATPPISCRTCWSIRTMRARWISSAATGAWRCTKLRPSLCQVLKLLLCVCVIYLSLNQSEDGQIKN